MRSLLLPLVFALAAPLAAQTQLADSAGAYVGLSELTFGSDHLFGLDGVVGHRYHSGLDIGVRVAARRQNGGSYQRLQIAPTVGYTRPLALGVLGRIEASAEYASLTRTFSSFGSTPAGGLDVTSDESGARTLGLDLAASMSRPVRLAGSVRVHPTVGGYVAAVRAFDVRRSAIGPSHLSLAPGESQVGYGLGAEIALPVSFRLFGADAALVPHARLQLSGDVLRLQRAAGLDPVGGIGFRLNF